MADDIAAAALRRESVYVGLMVLDEKGHRMRLHLEKLPGASKASGRTWPIA